MTRFLLLSLIASACSGAPFSAADEGPGTASGGADDAGVGAGGQAATGGSTARGGAGTGGRPVSATGGDKATGGHAGAPGTGGASTGGETADARPSGTGGEPTAIDGGAGGAPDCVHDLCCGGLLCAQCSDLTGGGCCTTAGDCGCLYKQPPCSGTNCGPLFVCN
jgi:hypothetical protein